MQQSKGPFTFKEPGSSLWEPHCSLLFWALVRQAYTCLVLLLWPFIAGYILYQYKTKGKYTGHLARRLGLDTPTLRPTNPDEVCVWIHAVSLGETNATLPLIEKLLLESPKLRLIFSHMTQAGLDQGRRLLGDRVEHLILPPDWPWKMGPLMQFARPTKLVFVESDLWPNMIWQAKIVGAEVAIVNARLSPNAYSWHQRLLWITRALWERIDRVAAQSEGYAKQFISLGVNPSQVGIGGNMKLARNNQVDPEKLERWREFLPQEGGPVIALTCSHAPEELMCIKLAAKLISEKPIRWIVAPRRPDRFDEVFALFKEHGLDVARWSDPTAHPCQWLLVDAMGKLDESYKVADLALVGGTWCTHMGGHNFLEPVMGGVPTLYGPHVYKQPDFHQLAKETQLAVCVEEERLTEAVQKWLFDSTCRQSWQGRLKGFQANSHQSIEKTFSWIWPQGL